MGRYSKHDKKARVIKGKGKLMEYLFDERYHEQSEKTNHRLGKVLEINQD